MTIVTIISNSMASWFNSEITPLRFSPQNKIISSLFPRRLRSSKFKSSAMRSQVTKWFPHLVTVLISKLCHNFVQNMLRNSKNSIKIQRLIMRCSAIPSKTGLLLPVYHRAPVRVSIQTLPIAFHQREPYLVGKKIKIKGREKNRNRYIGVFFLWVLSHRKVS